MRARDRIRILLLLGAFWSGWAGADITRTGEIFGTVKGEDGTLLPGATVRLTGDALIQREVFQTTDSRGTYRFNNVLPGDYLVTVTMGGFATSQTRVTVNVGRTSSIETALPLSRAAEELIVTAEAPLVDKTSPALQTNYDVEKLAQIPSSRNFIDVVDTAPGLDNRMAFGAGGNVDGYDVFGYGAATNQYQLNGVGTSLLQFGNAWVNPNYDTIAEVQIVGPGASAEYSQFTGGTVNVITKAGTNEFHGGSTVYGWSSKLQANNTGGIIDLDQPTTDYAIEANAFLGGPIIPEKFMFFASASYNPASQAPIETTFFDEQYTSGYQLRLDYLANNSNTLSAMYDYEPIKYDDQGLEPGLGPEVGFFREQHTNTGYFSWISTWTRNTLTEVKYGGGEGYLGRIPNNTTDIAVYDGSTGLYYNAQPLSRTQRNWRHAGSANVTHYLEEFLGGSHELKAGFEYEWQKTTQVVKTNQNTILNLIPIGEGLTYVSGIVGYGYNVSTSLQRPGVFVQDRVTWDRITVNLGVRYDHSSTYDEHTGNKLLDFTNWSPRVGVTWDVTGKGNAIFGASYGRYYDKVPTYGPGTYAGTGTQTTTYYGTVTDQVFDPEDPATIAAFVIQPQYVTNVFDSFAVPVEPDTGNPYSDIVSARFEYQFNPRFAASASYLYRHTQDYVTLTQFADNVTYAPFEYTSPVTGETFTSYTVTGGGPRLFALGNMDFWFQEGNEVILELRSQPTQNAFINASFVWQHLVGTRDNNECGVLSLCTNGVDTDPNYELNPFYNQGELSQNRPYYFKLLGSYRLPYGFIFGADFRYFSGRPWGAIDYSFAIGDPRFNDPYYQGVLLEPKDARTTPSSTLLNLRAQKDFNFANNVTLSLIVDVLNVTNDPIDYTTNIQNNVTAIYPRQSTIEGQPVSAFGQPYQIAPPRTTRLGLRLVF